MRGGGQGRSMEAPNSVALGGGVGGAKTQDSCCGSSTGLRWGGVGTRGEEGWHGRPQRTLGSLDLILPKFNGNTLECIL